MKRFCGLRGIGGSLLSEQDFVVGEIIGRKFLQQYRRGAGGVEKISGPYTILKVTKTGTTTERAIERIARIYGVPKESIGFAGLKDKRAVTTQYITIKNFSGKNFCEKNLSVERIGASSRPISVGDLEANRFGITLHSCGNMDNLDTILTFLSEKGMPNYFGGQRFGRHGDNHAVGRRIVRKNFAAALKKINSRGKHFSDIRKVGKSRLKFYVNAYQSHIFNRMLGMHIEGGGKPHYGNVQVVGAVTKLENDAFGKLLKAVMKKEKIKTSDFAISDLRLACAGGVRPAFVKPRFERVDVAGDAVRLRFTLPKGSYATVLMKEVTG